MPSTRRSCWRCAARPIPPIRIGPGWLEEQIRDITALGSLGVLTLVSLAAVGFLILQGKRRTALLVVAAVGGGMLVSTLTKLGFDRPRPDLVPHADRRSTPRAFRAATP